MTIRLQLAVQGGGAKLCGLLAALDAVQRLEKLGLIQVTRIAGTSAGAIAAALFAAGVNFEHLRRRIIDNRKGLERIVPPPNAWQLVRAARGQPMVAIDPIRDALRAVLAEHKVSLFKDLRIPLHVVATDLTNGRAHVYATEKEPQMDVVNAVLDSCAIPFYLRGPSTANGGMLLVDGGICENFPVDVLDSDEKTHGLITGITFRTGSRGAPESVFDFAVSLLDAAIANSVRRAQRTVLERRLLLLDPKPETLNFQWALHEGMEGHYHATLAESDRFFRTLADVEAPAPPSPAVSPTPPAIHDIVDVEEDVDSLDTLHRHDELFRAQHADVKVKYHEVRMLVRAGGSLVGQRAPDFLQYQMQFSAFERPLECVRIGVSGDTAYEFLQTLRTEVYDHKHARRRTIQLKARDPQRPSYRSYLLFFSPAIHPDETGAPFRLQYSHELRGVFRELHRTGVDCMQLSTMRAGTTTPKITLLTVLPKTHPGYYLRESLKTTGKTPGRPMTPEETNAVVLELALTPAEYLLGWIGEDIAPGTIFSADICAPGY